MASLDRLATLAKTLFAIGIVFLMASALPAVSGPSRTVLIAILVPLAAFQTYNGWRMLRDEPAFAAVRANLAASTSVLAVIASATAIALSEGRIGVAGWLATLAGLWFAWRAWKSAVHLRDRTLPPPRLSGIDDSRRMIRETRDMLTRRDGHASGSSADE